MDRRERMLAQAEVDAVLVACKPAWRGLFPVLYLTWMGAMSEAAALTADHLDRPRKPAVLLKHKNRKKSGTSRIIYFPPAAWEVIDRLATKLATGPLFRNRDSRPLGSGAMNEYLKAACKR